MPEPSKYKAAYIVGVRDDGEIEFSLLGDRPTLLELLGLHKYATQKVQDVQDEKMMRGGQLTHEVGKAVALLNKRFDDLEAAIKAYFSTPK